MDNTPSASAKTILLVDDQDVCRITTKWFLTNFGYIVETVRTAEEGLLSFNPKVHDLVITDNRMPGMSGAEMAHVIKLRSPSTPIIMSTSVPPENVVCVDLVLRRPAHLLELKDAIEQILRARRSPEA